MKLVLNDSDASTHTEHLSRDLVYGGAIVVMSEAWKGFSL
jgi:hypothetical protein